MCGAINELTFVFNQVTLDGYKVAGFVPVCNSVLDDSDIDLSGYIVEMLSESIGLAMDKAILYGKGAASKMPMGIVTRLAQTTQLDNYPADAPAWVDLHTSNILKVNSGLDAVTFWGCSGYRCRQHLHRVCPRHSVLGHELQNSGDPEVQADHLCCVRRSCWPGLTV